MFSSRLAPALPATERARYLRVCLFCHGVHLCEHLLLSRPGHPLTSHWVCRFCKHRIWGL